MIGGGFTLILGPSMVMGGIARTGWDCLRSTPAMLECNLLLRRLEGWNSSLKGRRVQTQGAGRELSRPARTRDPPHPASLGMGGIARTGWDCLRSAPAMLECNLLLRRLGGGYRP